MSQPPVTVRLDPRRLDQLKAIASAMNLTNAGVISELIRAKIAEGVIPADIPGIVVRKEEGGVFVSLREGDSIVMSAHGAQKLAATIRDTIATSASPITVNPAHDFSVERKGNGLKVALPFGGSHGKEIVSFPIDLALDIAELLEKAAA